MSYLNGPRINFWGGGSTNVDTANNSNSIEINGKTETLVDVVSAMVTADKTDEELITMLREPATQLKPCIKEKEEENYFVNAGWNYYGDHQVAFMDTKVSSSGKPGSVDPKGDLVGQPVYLLGSVDPISGDGPYGGPVMVDLDPTSSQSTQIYVGGLQIGNEDPLLLVRHNTHCHSRFLGLRYTPCVNNPPYAAPGSVWGSGTFQVAFPKQAIVSYDKNIQILKDIIEDPRSQGIVLRFCMFEFMPGMSTEELQKNYANNQNDSNPSLGRIVGTIGAWYEGEPATCPPGRYLQRFSAGANSPASSGLAELATDGKLISLDLLSTLPGANIRQDSTDNTSPIGPNVDYGDLKIGTTEKPDLLSTPSLADDYYLYGGLYDLPLNSTEFDTLSNSPIEITSSKNGLSIKEAPLRIYGDDRNIYLNDIVDGANIELQIRELGGPLHSDTPIGLSTGISGALPDAGFLNYPKSITAATGSTRIQFPIGDNGGNAGFLALNLSSGEASYFINFRKYPNDDLSAAMSADEISWEGPQGVYEQCLRFYYVLFPGMSKRIPLNDQPTINAVAPEIMKRTSEQYRNTTLYMPLTRSMSPGKIHYLRAYLQQVIDRQNAG